MLKLILIISSYLPCSNILSINKDTVKVLDKSKPVLVYCNTGQRARYAANKLDKLGFSEVVYIDGTYNTIM